MEPIQEIRSSKDDGICLRQRSTFPVWTSDRLRLCDTDMLGHINNTVYAAFCESGRVVFLGRPAQGCDFALVRLLINFHHEIYYPGEVEIGTCALAVGRTSITLGHGLFMGDRCVATSEGTCVLIDLASRRPIPIPAHARQGFESHLAVATGPAGDFPRPRAGLACSPDDGGNP